MNTVHCEICGVNIKTLGFGYHVSKLHNITSREYYDKFLKKPDEGICEQCGAPTRYYRFGKYLRFCSNECSNTNKNVITAKSETLRKHYGVDYVLQIDGMQSHIEKDKLIYDGILFDSSWEVQYYIYCKDHDIKCEYHPIGL